MSYIKRKRDRRDYELRRVLESHLIWRPRFFLEANKKAIEEELAHNTNRIWAAPEPVTITPIWGSR